MALIGLYGSSLLTSTKSSNSDISLAYNNILVLIRELLSQGSLDLKIRRDETSPGRLLRLSSSVGVSCGWPILIAIIGLARVGSGGNCGGSERGAWKARLD